MFVVYLILIVAAAGFLGGLINALISDNYFILPQYQAHILRPGFLGNAIIGAVAAFVSWGLYSASAVAFLIGGPDHGSSPEPLGLTLASLASAMLVGIGGARWLSNEVDKKLLQSAASLATGKRSDPNKASQVASASPAAALQIVQDIVDG